MQKIIVYAILALRRFLILSNQHHFNERGDGTDKKAKSTLTVLGTGGGIYSASLCIIKIPFENLVVLSVFLVVVLLILVCSTLFVIGSNKRTRNLKNLKVDWFGKNNKNKNKGLPSERKKHH